MSDDYDQLKLSNQLCFPLYVCSKEIVRRYKPFLDEVNLTYTQYITMMAFWETPETNVKDLGKKLFLDSGTLTPVLKTLEEKGFITRRRSSEDERNLLVSITEKGCELRQKCSDIPSKLACTVKLNADQASSLKEILSTLMQSL